MKEFNSIFTAGEGIMCSIPYVLCYGVEEKVLTYLYNDQKVYVGAAKSYQVSLPRMISTEPQGTYN